MRNISCSLTADQVLNRTKTVTRRKGWKFLKAGDRLQVVRKAMGLKKGEHPENLAVVEVVSVRREPLDAIEHADVAREGFPGMSRLEFLLFFCNHMGGPCDQPVTRIEWKYIDEGKERRI
jgi:hypothetical protein